MLGAFEKVSSRILVVDDHPEMRKALRRLLEAVPGFEICGEAENGRQAIEMAPRLSPDLIILDLSMPVMNGLTAAKALRELLPQTPILLYSSFAYADLAEEALKAGVTSVETKTASPQSLLSMVKKLLNQAA
jgi:DNA-binding NarL/FixJ family response regulator